MILVDANLLIHAYNSGSPFHSPARDWLVERLNGSSGVGLSSTNILAFLRITTHSRLFDAPLTWAEATAKVEAWLKRPCVTIVEPGNRHWTILQSFFEDEELPGPLVMDAHLAALAIEHDATLCTADRDFRRFKGLRLEYPLATKGDSEGQ